MIQNRVSFIGVVLLCWLYISTFGFAQDTAVAVSDKVVEATQDEQGALTLNYKGASLINVLGSLSEISKINFVAGNEIAGREVNMSLDGVSLEQALQAISNGINVTYSNIADTNIIMFRASSDQPNLSPLYTRVFKLFFLRASKVQEIDAGSSSSGGSGSTGGGLISFGVQKESTGGGDIPILKIMEKMISERGSVSVDDRSNSVIVTDTEDRLARVAAVVAELDRPMNQVLINVLLVETFEDLDRELGITWSGDFGTLTGGSANTAFPFSDGNKFNPLGSLLKANDTGGLPPLDAETNLFNPSTATQKYGSKNFSSLTVNAQALQTASKLKILAKPNILVMDNHPAIIKIATNAAIGNQTVTATTGDSETAANSQTAQAERAEIGTILRVTPQINSQDQITMTIEPIFATLDNSAITLTGNATGDTTVRAARTTVMVNSGKTLVMGGLLFSEQTDGDSKVPFLGDLPVLGRLFTHDSKTIQDRELVLFITPQIIKNPAAMNPSYVPNRDERFDDVNSEFWKYKKKTWYKNVAAGGPKKPVDYDSFFKVRENTMDEAAFALQDQKESAMKSEVQTVGKTTSASDGVQWSVL